MNALATQVVNLFAAALLLIAFAMLSQRRIVTLIHLFQLQGLALVGSTVTVAIATAQTQFPLNGNGVMGLGNRNGDFFIEQDDLRVKVPGGYARINRDHDGRKWVFNRQWSGLGDPNFYKADYPTIGAFFTCTIIDGIKLEQGTMITDNRSRGVISNDLGESMAVPINRSSVQLWRALSAGLRESFSESKVK